VGEEGGACRCRSRSTRTDDQIEGAKGSGGADRLHAKNPALSKKQVRVKVLHCPPENKEGRRGATLAWGIQNEQNKHSNVSEGKKSNERQASRVVQVEGMDQLRTSPNWGREGKQPSRRELSAKQFPSSQPERGWEKKKQDQGGLYDK